MTPLTDEVLVAVAKAINHAIYGTEAEERWAQSSEVRDARKREVLAAINAYEKSPLAQS
jgi:hypothetical protein